MKSYKYFIPFTLEWVHADLQLPLHTHNDFHDARPPGYQGYHRHLPHDQETGPSAALHFVLNVVRAVKAGSCRGGYWHVEQRAPWKRIDGCVVRLFDSRGVSMGIDTFVA